MSEGKIRNLRMTEHEKYALKQWMRAYDYLVYSPIVPEDHYELYDHLKDRRFNITMKEAEELYRTFFGWRK